MKIVHVCLAQPYYNDYWGYQENIIPKYQKKDGHDVTVITSVLRYDVKGSNGFREVNPGSYVLTDGVKVVRIPYKRSPLNKRLRMYVGLYEKLCAEKPEIIFVHGCQFLDIRHIVRYVKVNRNVRVYVDNHADFVNSARNFVSRNVLHRWLWRYCAKSIEPFTCKFYGVLPARVDFLKQVYNISECKVDLLVMGADTEKINLDKWHNTRTTIRQKLTLDEDDFVIITGGKIDEKKKIHCLMDAVNRLGDDKVKLIVFGLPNNEMKRVVESLTSSATRYVGWLSADEVYDYFLASDLAVFPGTHSVLWEQAVGTGLPAIFKKWDGMTHVDVGGNCMFVEEGIVEELLLVIESVVRDKNHYNKMKHVAVTKGIPYFSYANIARVAIGEKTT